MKKYFNIHHTIERPGPTDYSYRKAFKEMMVVSKQKLISGMYAALKKKKRKQNPKNLSLQEARCLA